MPSATTITVEDGGRPLPRADETEKVSEKVPEEDIHARALTDSLNRDERNLVDLSFSSTDETFRAELREVLLRDIRLQVSFGMTNSCPQETTT